MIPERQRLCRFHVIFRLENFCVLHIVLYPISIWLFIFHSFSRNKYIAHRIQTPKDCFKQVISHSTDHWRAFFYYSQKSNDVSPKGKLKFSLDMHRWSSTYAVNWFSSFQVFFLLIRITLWLRAEVFLFFNIFFFFFHLKLPGIINTYHVYAHFFI